MKVGGAEEKTDRIPATRKSAGYKRLKVSISKLFKVF